MRQTAAARGELSQDEWSMIGKKPCPYASATTTGLTAFHTMLVRPRSPTKIVLLCHEELMLTIMLAAV